MSFWKLSSFTFCHLFRDIVFPKRIWGFKHALYGHQTYSFSHHIYQAWKNTSTVVFVGCHTGPALFMWPQTDRSIMAVEIVAYRNKSLAEMAHSSIKYIYTIHRELLLARPYPSRYKCTDVWSLWLKTYYASALLHKLMMH